MAGVVVSGAQVSYISQDCEEIPEFLGRKYGRVAKRLDLSFNLLRQGASDQFVRCVLPLQKHEKRNVQLSPQKQNLELHGFGIFEKLMLAEETQVCVVDRAVKMEFL
ncbi:hypothetical protein Q9966_003327 [Columba livia]|nr:hypothetical protein Q9966_003327 [Columba livia]